jgi:hypothetical protein
MIVANKIVFVGCGGFGAGVKHIAKLRKAGDDVYIADSSCGEQMVRRIIDADEVHLFEVDRDDAFELGMVYFFTVHALHYKLHWKIKVFNCDAEIVDQFINHEPALEPGEKLVTSPILLPIPPDGIGLPPGSIILGETDE